MALRRTLVVTQFYGRIKGGHLGAKKAYESMCLRRFYDETEAYQELKHFLMIYHCDSPKILYIAIGCRKSHNQGAKVYIACKQFSKTLHRFSGPVKI